VHDDVDLRREELFDEPGDGALRRLGHRDVEVFQPRQGQPHAERVVGPEAHAVRRHAIAVALGGPGEHLVTAPREHAAEARGGTDVAVQADVDDSNACQSRESTRGATTFMLIAAANLVGLRDQAVGRLLTAGPVEWRA
jgi:hypothetical protein